MGNMMLITTAIADALPSVESSTVFSITQTTAIGGGNVSTDRIAHKHPAIFPEQLAKDHIVSWSNPSDLVVDIYSGSGTTCVAAKMLGRRYIGIDISPEYCEIARERLKAIETGVVPPVSNLREQDLECPVNISKEAREMKLRAAVKNSYGIGGTNCSLVLRKL